MTSKEQAQAADEDPAERHVRPLTKRLCESADEVMEFPHPSACDHLHDAAALMREASDEIERLRTALTTIARLPIEEQDNLLARNMRIVARVALGELGVGALLVIERPNVELNGTP